MKLKTHIYLYIIIIITQIKWIYLTAVKLETYFHDLLADYFPFYLVPCNSNILNIYVKIK